MSIDGEKAVGHFKADYVMPSNIPAGKHTIEFKFETPAKKNFREAQLR
jgi:hypothetical protein